MCYAKPGPRCSNHATKALEKAHAAYKADSSQANLELVAAAQNDYNLTPKGIKEIREAGISLINKREYEEGAVKVKQAETLAAERTDLIARASDKKDNHNPQASVEETQKRVNELTSEYDALAADITYEHLQAKSNYELEEQFGWNLPNKQTIRFEVQRDENEVAVSGYYEYLLADENYVSRDIIRVSIEDVDLMEEQGAKLSELTNQIHSLEADVQT